MVHGFWEDEDDADDCDRHVTGNRNEERRYDGVLRNREQWSVRLQKKVSITMKSRNRETNAKNVENDLSKCDG